MREANLLLAVCSDEGPEKSLPSRILGKGESGGRGSFQVGQTAKARPGYRVQSLPKDATASFRINRRRGCFNPQSTERCSFLSFWGVNNVRRYFSAPTFVTRWEKLLRAVS